MSAFISFYKTLSMQNIQDKAEDLSGHVIDYLDTMYKLGKVKVSEKAANSAANAVTGITIIVFTSIILLIAGIGIGWWIGESIDNMPAGFLIMAVFYLCCLFLLIFMRKRIMYPRIRNRIIKKIYE